MHQTLLIARHVPAFFDCPHLERAWNRLGKKQIPALHLETLQTTILFIVPLNTKELQSTVKHIPSIMFQLVVAVGLSLNIANLIGYVRCKKDAGKKIKTFAGNFLGRQLLNQVPFSFKFSKY